MKTLRCQEGLLEFYPTHEPAALEALLANFKQDPGNASDGTKVEEELHISLLFMGLIRHSTLFRDQSRLLLRVHGHVHTDFALSCCHGPSRVHTASWGLQGAQLGAHTQHTKTIFSPSCVCSCVVNSSKRKMQGE